jgi:hypothetical protein
MSCESCQEAETNPRSGLYHSGCLECSCRALSDTPEAWRAIKGLTNAPLQQAMQKLAGHDSDKYKHIRERVWHWIGRRNAK